MQIWLSLFLFSTLTWANCDFQSKLKGIYSLSGPVTTGLSEIGLHRSSKLKGISSFYTGIDKNFQGDRIPGGSLLSPVTVRSLEPGIVFFDESQEMEKILRSFGKGLVLKKISTRNLTPVEVTQVVSKVLDSVTSDCGPKLREFQKSVESLQGEILLKIPEKFDVVFFLGSFEGASSPNLVMAQDGFVKWLKKDKRVKTYPTELAYVPWSAKILKGEMKGAYQIGLVDGPDPKCIKHDPKKYTCHFPRALTPGIDQLRALRFILDQI